MLYKDLNEGQKIIIDQAFDRYSTITFDLYNKVSERVINALLISNGGALIAILGFIAGYNNEKKYLALPLIFFLFGFIAILLLCVIDYLIVFKRLHDFFIKYRQAINSQISFQEVFPSKFNWFWLCIIMFFGISSLILFILGSCEASRSFLKILNIDSWWKLI